MVEATKDLEHRLPRLTLAELADMVTTHRTEYADEAISMIQRELVRRGVTGIRPEGQPTQELEPGPRPLSWWYPSIDTEQSALRVARQGAVAAWVVAGVTAIFAVLASRVHAISAIGMDLSALLDAVVFVAIGVGIWRGSLLFAVLGVIAHVGERIFWWVTAGKTPGALALLVFLAFLNGVRGTRALRRYRATNATIPALPIDGA